MGINHDTLHQNWLLELCVEKELFSFPLCRIMLDINLVLVSDA